jgi:hypothetical protein
MSSQVIIRDPNAKPRRALSNSERHELFREFKLGLFALAALAVLVITLCWDRGQGTKEQPVVTGDGANLVIQVRTGPGRGDPAPIPDPNLRQPTPNPAPPPPPPPPPPPYREYIVQKTDTSLEKIAAKTLGSGQRWPLIKEANPGLDPRRMRVGQTLRIPWLDAPASAAAGQLAHVPSGTGHLLNANGQ